MKRRVFSDDEVRAILADARPQGVVAAAYGTWKHVISDIKGRRTYRHVRFSGKVARYRPLKRVKAPRPPDIVRYQSLPVDPGPQYSFPPAENRKVFSDDEVRAILADPRMYGEIAAEYGTWKHVISCMKWRRSYRNVPFDGVIVRYPSRKTSRLTV
jgi:hypothetical protein